MKTIKINGFVKAIAGGLIVTIGGYYILKRVGENQNSTEDSTNQTIIQDDGISTDVPIDNGTNLSTDNTTQNSGQDNGSNLSENSDNNLIPDNNYIDALNQIKADNKQQFDNVVSSLTGITTLVDAQQSAIGALKSTGYLTQDDLAKYAQTQSEAFATYADKVSQSLAAQSQNVNDLVTNSVYEALANNETTGNIKVTLPDNINITQPDSGKDNFSNTVITTDSGVIVTNQNPGSGISLGVNSISGNLTLSNNDLLSIASETGSIDIVSSPDSIHFDTGKLSEDEQAKYTAVAGQQALVSSVIAGALSTQNNKTLADITGLNIALTDNGITFTQDNLKKQQYEDKTAKQNAKTLDTQIKKLHNAESVLDTIEGKIYQKSLDYNEAIQKGDYKKAKKLKNDIDELVLKQLDGTNDVISDNQQASILAAGLSIPYDQFSHSQEYEKITLVDIPIETKQNKKVDNTIPLSVNLAGNNVIDVQQPNFSIDVTKQNAQSVAITTTPLSIVTNDISKATSNISSIFSQPKIDGKEQKKIDNLKKENANIQEKINTKIDRKSKATKNADIKALAKEIENLQNRLDKNNQKIAELSK
jgi:hypothetical protein